MRYPTTKKHIDYWLDYIRDTLHLSVVGYSSSPGGARYHSYTIRTPDGTPLADIQGSTRDTYMRLRGFIDGYKAGKDIDQ